MLEDAGSLKKYLPQPHVLFAVKAQRTSCLICSVWEKITLQNLLWLFPRKKQNSLICFFCEISTISFFLDVFTWFIPTLFFLRWWIFLSTKRFSNWSSSPEEFIFCKNRDAGDNMSRLKKLVSLFIFRKSKNPKDPVRVGSVPKLMEKTLNVKKRGVVYGWSPALRPCDLCRRSWFESAKVRGEIKNTA